MWKRGNSEVYNFFSNHNFVKQVPHRDFYNIRKVDTHVHHSSCMNQVLQAALESFAFLLQFDRSVLSVFFFFVFLFGLLVFIL